MNIKTTFFLAAILISPVLQGTQIVHASEDDAKETFIIIDHSSNSYEVMRKPIFAKHEKVSILVENTDKSCYSYNLEIAKQEDVRRAPAKANDVEVFIPINSDLVPFTVFHDPSTAAYEIDIKKISEEGHCINQPFKKTYPVTTSAWKLAFSGAITYDGLTNKKYFLESGSQVNTNGMSTNGFFVRENVGGEDDGGTGFALLAHLYHETKFSSKKYEVGWAPLTFGLGTGSDSESNFYLGTSAKIGDALFVTAGFISGKKLALPTELSVGSFTNDENALTTLGNRTDTSYFLGLSYEFGDINLSRFSSPFAKAKPAPNLVTE